MLNVNLYGANMKKSTLIVMLSATALLAACSGKHEAGKSEFKKAINQAVQQRRVCLPVPLELLTKQGVPMSAKVLLGESEIHIYERNIKGEHINKQPMDQMGILVGKDFYKLARTEVDTATYDNFTLSKDIYILTDKGRQQIQASPQGPLLCLGKEEVKEINWYTEPTPSNGVTISKVSYQAEFKPESWAKKLLKEDDETWKDLKEIRTQTATMVKTSDGWRDIYELH